ncbi:hypothetical protein RO3G_13986 [Lichtheimia corymbifera JMRC:FSU:9682]|uniref:Autophagy-related protein 17 n=1 Tax=Lichtheimia corymbifera JMRC:FSU:9682 TaxID=1263082 RepID=A0A068RMF9_9FUNG|nr:hypothetical protein RO3G_13986 [Lichtheimia corymbifera JMRC:FSU:9682]
MEQELIELLLVAKKALSTGQAICAQANELSQESDRHVEIIERTWAKILFVRNHVLIQLSTLERIREFLSVKIDEVRSCIQDREENLAEVSLNLQNIFRVLKGCTIDPGIMAINTQQDDQRKQHATLFDYIDHQSVLDIQKQADDEIGDIENLYSSLMTTAKSLSVTISELASMQEAALSISLDKSASAFSDDKAQIQEITIAKMADILTSLTNHYIQLGEATRLYQSEPNAPLDISVLQKDHEQVPRILDDLRESLEIVESIRNPCTNAKKFSTPGGQADTICDKMVNAEAEMKTHEQKLAAYFKELTSLAEWYQVYAASYSHLVLEIERRKKATERQEELVKELTQSFEDAYNDEYQERRRWFAQHGSFLPEGLCQFMTDPPSRLYVHIDEQSRRLPDLSPSTVKKALADIHDRSTTTS